MWYSCGSCGHSINISTKLYLAASVWELDTICLENEFHSTFTSFSPFEDSVLDEGEITRSASAAVLIDEDISEDIDESIDYVHEEE